MRQPLPPLLLRWLFVFITVAAAAAQTPPLNCSPSSGLPTMVRAEGSAEPVGDVVIACAGGVPTPGGQLIPTVDIQIHLNVTVSSRLLADPLLEALLIIDDPEPARQFPCIPPAGLSTCYNYQGRSFGGGDPGTATVAGANKNVFFGRLAAANSIVWHGIPVDPPGPLAMRTFRITNVRGVARELGISTSLIPPEVYMFLAATPPSLLPLSSSVRSVGVQSRGMMDQSVRGPSGDETIKTFFQCAGANESLKGNNAAAYTGVAVLQPGQDGRTGLLRFIENFPAAFKRRTVAAPVIYTADVSPAPHPQDYPGGIVPLPASGVGSGPYNAAGQYGPSFAESVFYNPSFPIPYASAGLADHGTRLIARFYNVPSAVSLYVGLYEVETSAAGAPMRSPGTSRVRLISTDASGGGPFSPAPATSMAESAGQSTTFGSLAPVTLAGGNGIAVWEVMQADPLSVEAISVPFAIAYTSSSSPVLGTAGVALDLAPSFPPNVASPELPRFTYLPFSTNLFTVSPCFTASPAVVGLTYKIGAAAPAPVSIRIFGGVTPLAFQASTPASWLSLRLASGTTPGFLKVSVQPAGLAAGTYQTSINVSFPGALSAPAIAIPSHCGFVHEPSSRR